MQIPKRLESLLAQDPALDGAVKASVATLEVWISGKQLTFFPEYTDHGIKHLEAVLATEVALIREAAWEILTPQDAGVLLLSTVLHDCAMHLTDAGWVSLLQDPWANRTLPNRNERSWTDLWEDFLAETSRFDGRTLKSLFGDLTTPRRPPSNSMDLTKRDRMLIGEFLRRHHPRLAEEVAVFGVPGTRS